MIASDRRKLSCLADAEYAGAPGRTGLQRTRASWAVPEASGLDHHHFLTVSRLITDGYLQLYDKGRCAHITDGGRCLLERLRENAAKEAGVPPVRSCRVCGCTDARACPGGCWWVGPRLCSSCARTDADD